MNEPMKDDRDRILVFPKGTIVKYDGIPCELLHDTPYESATIRNASTPDPDDGGPVPFIEGWGG